MQRMTRLVSTRLISPAVLLAAAGTASAQWVFAPLCNNNWYGECTFEPCPSGGWVQKNNWGQVGCSGGLPLPTAGSTVSIGATTCHINNTVQVAGLSTGASTIMAWDTGDLYAGATLNTPGQWVVSNSNKTLSSNVVNTGTWELINGWTLYFAPGVTFTNNNLVRVADKDINKPSGTTAFVNNGTVEQYGGTGDSWIGLTITNNGTWRSTSGMWIIEACDITSAPASQWLSIPGSMWIRNSTINGTIAGNQTGTMGFASGITFTGPTTFNCTGNGAYWSDGNFTVSPGASFANAGVLSVPASNKLFHGNLANAGTMSLYGGWTLTLEECNLTNTGTINIHDKDIARAGPGSINNSGLIDQLGGTADTINTGWVINNNAGGHIRSTSGGLYLDNDTVNSDPAAQWTTGGNIWVRNGIMNGTFNITNPSGFGFAWSATFPTATTFNVTGNPLLWNDGDFNINNGLTLNGAGMTVINANKMLRGTLTLNAPLNLVNGWTLLLDNAVINNNGTINIADKEIVKSNQGVGTINNNGVIDQTGGTADSIAGITINNNAGGTMRSTSGALYLDGDSITSAPGSAWQTGGSMSFRQSTMRGIYNVTNPGAFYFSQGNTFDANTTINATGNAVRWGDGDLTINPGATLTFTSGTGLFVHNLNKGLNGDVVNNGTCTLAEGWGLYLNSGTFTNNGTIALVDKDIVYGSAAATGVLVNNGLIEQIGGTGDSFAGGVRVVNHGTIRSTSGGLYLNDAAVTNDGTFRADAHIRLPDSYNHAAGVIQGIGSFNAATLLNHTGGSIAPGNNSVSALGLYGNYNLGGTGKVAIELAGNTSYDTFNLLSGWPAGIASFNGGVIEVTRVGSFVPTPGATFRVLTFRERSGTNLIGGVVSANPAPGVAYRAVYGPTYVDLLVLGRCGVADVGRQGGLAGPDGVLDNNDFIVFINGFFSADPVADLGIQGGLPGADGMFDNNDFVVYVNGFFEGCAS